MTNLAGSRQKQAAQNIQNSREQFGRNNNLKVIIDYTDTTGERRSVEKNVPIQFRAAAGDASTGTLQTGQFQRQQHTGFLKSKAFIIIVILAALVLGFVLYRKKGLRGKIIGFIKRKK